MTYKKVLVVDDDRNSRVALGLYLEDMGMETDLAQSREKAMELVRGKPYDLCISDGLEGEWILLHDDIKSINRSTKFILLSGDSDQIDKAREFNIEAYGKDNVNILLNSLK